MNRMIGLFSFDTPSTFDTLWLFFIVLYSGLEEVNIFIYILII